MERVLVSAASPDPAAIAAAARVLRDGGVVAYPTDTLYGLAVDPRSEAAVLRLFELKARESAAAIPLIASDVDQALAAGALGPVEGRLAAEFWPGPLSIVVAARRTLSRAVLGGGGSVAIRVPAHDVARTLAKAHGFCITATSANLSGTPAAASADDVIVALGSRLEMLDLLIDGGPAAGGLPSTIVEVTADGPVLRRAGAIAWERVIKSLR